MKPRTVPRVRVGVSQKGGRAQNTTLSDEIVTAYEGDSSQTYGKKRIGEEYLSDGNEGSDRMRGRYSKMKMARKFNSTPGNPRGNFFLEINL